MPVEIPSAAELLKWETETKPALTKATQTLALDKLQRAAELGSSIAQQELLRREGITGMGQGPLQLLRWPEEWGAMPESPWHRPTALPPPTTGVQFYMSPKGWGFTEDFSAFISPEGEEFTLAEAQTELAHMGFEALVYDYNQNLFVPSTLEFAKAREAQYTQMQVNLGKMGEPGFVAPPGTPGAITIEEYQRRIADVGTMASEQRQILTDAFASVFPGQTIDDLFALVNDMVIDADAMSFDEVAEATELQIEFLETIREVGRTPETELLLQTIFPGIDEAGMSELFGTIQPDMEVPFDETKVPKEIWQSVRTGETITQDEKDKRYPLGYEIGLDEWVLTREAALQYPAVLKVIGEAITKLPMAIASAFLDMLGGTRGVDIVDKTWQERLIEEASSDMQRFIASLNRWGLIYLST